MALSNVRWKGMKAFGIMLDVLPGRLAGQKLRTAYRFALKPTLQMMKANLPPNRTGALWHATDITIGGTNDLMSMYALVGPRRRRNTWNMAGWAAHLVEKGTKPHTITAGPGKMMPVFTKHGFTGKFAKTIDHKGSKAFKPFQKSIDATWSKVGDRAADKLADIMRSEIKEIFLQYGQVVTSTGRVIQGR